MVQNLDLGYFLRMSKPAVWTYFLCVPSMCCCAGPCCFRAFLSREALLDIKASL